MTALACIRHQGSVHSGDLYFLSKEILEFCQAQGISLVPVHLSGILNVLADQGSRQGPIVTEWSLDRYTFLQICYFMGFFPEVDLFATRFNSHLLCIVSPFPDAMSFGLGYPLPKLVPISVYLCISPNEPHSGCSNEAQKFFFRKRVYDSPIVAFSNLVSGAESEVPREVPSSSRVCSLPVHLRRSSGCNGGTMESMVLDPVTDLSERVSFLDDVPIYVPAELEPLTSPSPSQLSSKVGSPTNCSRLALRQISLILLQKLVVLPTC